MKQFLLLIPCILALFLVNSCQDSPGKNHTEKTEYEFDGGDQILYINASKYGSPTPETFVYMQNKRGIRAEYCLDRSSLELWVSPLAGKSIHYQDRNWSNRDDHTMLFDRIKIPGFPLSDFDSCDYDPFHLVLYYKNNTLHLSQVYSEPSIMVWFEKPGHIDFKVNADLIGRTPKSLVVEEEDRGRNFEFSLFLGQGEGQLVHQPVLDENRSIHARAELADNQFVLISGELASERVSTMAKKYAQKGIDEILAENDRQIEKALQPGTFTLNGHDEMQKLLAVNKRVVHSLQDFSGIMRTTSQYIYYLLWYRDAGVNSTFLSYTGWAEPAMQNANIVLQNPNISKEEPAGKFFGQLMGGPLSKWEEDGLYFVVWPAFAYYTQTGDDKFCKGGYLENMEAGMKWLEDYCFDEEMGLFGRYFANETPFKGSHDFGFDYATGAPTGKWIIEHEGKPVVRTYDYYINLYNYNVYLMLAAMTEGEKSENYLQKAKSLEEKMRPFYAYDDEMPSYGYVETEDGAKELVDWDAIDHTDFLWPASIAMFHPNVPKVDKRMRTGMYRYLRQEPKGNFICAYNSVLTAMDTKVFPEDSIMAALEYLVPQSTRPGKYRPMPYAIPEMVDELDGHPFHDVRPIGYSISPWMSAVTNLGVRRLPFGIAMRPTKSLSSIKRYTYQQGFLDIDYSGQGENIKSLSINGKKLEGSLQVPLSWLTKGSNKVVVEMDKGAKPVNLLVSSTVQLNDIKKNQGNTSYQVKAYGHNVLVFENLDKNIILTDQAGSQLETETSQVEGFSHVYFEGQGIYDVLLASE
jgi:hypothetical protein